MIRLIKFYVVFVNTNLQLAQLEWLFLGVEWYLSK